MKEMFSQSCTNLTDEHCIEFKRVLIVYEAIFVKGDTDLAMFTAVKVSLIQVMLTLPNKE